MTRWFGALISLVLALTSRRAFAEDTITVHVGLQGSFYSPSPVSAQLNDIIHFVFDGPFHDVTQSSFDNPCEPLAGGFSSGIAGRGANGTDPTPVWDLRVTNVTTPIWFYCGASIPVPHCTAGMVGAINPPSIAMFNAFQSNAKNTSFPTPIAVPVIALTGHGAFATASPSAPSAPATSAALTSSSSLATSSSASPAPTDSPLASSGSSHTAKGTIIGAAIGGGVGFLAICFLSFLLYRAVKKDKPSVSPYVNSSDTHGPPPKSMDINRSMSQLKIHRSPSDPTMLLGSGMSEISSVSGIGSPPTPQPLLAYSPPSAVQTATVANSSPPEPTRRVRPLPPSPQNAGNVFSQEQSSPPAPLPPSPPMPNINELAREVAAILQPSTSQTLLRAKPSHAASNTSASFLQLSEEGTASEHHRALKWQVNSESGHGHDHDHHDRERGGSFPPPPHYQSEE
ncbi:hypothetical protein ONZ45_g5676 [Pleurotus djamor]|nr:hypothetical protein ONZ45_g5676 [Pleurotus djamor]